MHAISHDAQVPGFIDQLLQQCTLEGVSDIHIEPQAQRVVIRVRQDGLLRQLIQLPSHVHPALTSRIKIMATLDIAEKRLPQDGRCYVTHNNTRADIRVSTCPSLYGEKTVMRILGGDDQQVDINNLGLTADQCDTLKKACKATQGLIVVTGPTGSGKTQSLYSMLSYLKHDAINIVSAEDPVEIRLDGITQVNVHHKANLTFATLLRAFLRQDPDVIMVGEIRDAQTAQMAIRAAQTGHLVLSTLHTNGAMATINRLINMGIAPHYVADALSLLVAQRLVRTVCKTCEGQGCDACHDGFSGRTGIFETLSPSVNLKHLMAQNASTDTLLATATAEGFLPLAIHAQQKVDAGITSQSEIQRVFGL
jgi:type II secretory ATPase GspE/PulE/Tfp pilus assembly ATPase PilB-like protein